MDFAPFWMAHTPLKMTIQEARHETDHAWRRSYSPERNAEALEAISDAPFRYRLSHLISRLFFRGIYFPQMNKRAWLKLVFDNRRPMYGLTKEAIGMYWSHRKHAKQPSEEPAPVMNEQKAA
jgi:hypothetical protein